MKTHWLQSPNKNYLGRWDLPDGNDAVLTIDSVSWEEVTNHTVMVKSKEGKYSAEVKTLRVIRFKEKHPWVKPFICNETNAKTIFECTEIPFVEDCIGIKIKIGISKFKVQGKLTEGIRVRKASQKDLMPKLISASQTVAIKNALLLTKDYSEKIICDAYKIESLSCIPEKDYDKIMKKIEPSSKPEGEKNENV